jgi:Transposase IS116/IS110/IS902 family
VSTWEGGVPGVRPQQAGLPRLSYVVALQQSRLRGARLPALSAPSGHFAYHPDPFPALPKRRLALSPSRRIVLIVGPKLLAQQLKSLLPYIARYEKQIAELFDAHPDSFLFRDLPGAGTALGPRLLTAFGTDRERFDCPIELSSLSGIAPVRRASGKNAGKKASVHFRHACPKFLRQSFHEFAECSIRYSAWAQGCYQAQRERGKGHHAAVRTVAFKWIRILFACWKQRLPYDPQRYLQTLQTRGSEYARPAA